MSEENKMMQVSEVEMRALLSEMAQLRQSVVGITNAAAPQVTGEVDRRGNPVRRRSVTILFLDGKPVVELKNMGTELNPVRLYDLPDPKDPRKTILSATIVVVDPKTGARQEFADVNYLEFISNAERKDCPIKDIQKKEWVIDKGYVETKQIKGDGYKMEVGDEVPMEVTGSDNYYVIDIDGNDVMFYQEYVNMAKSQPQAEKQYV